MLPVGTFLGEFEITGVIGEGGFGIVYLARDHSLHRRVALKEYMPSSLSARVGGTQVQVKSERHRETFEAGLHSFVNEARLLASFDHPSLVKVYRFWEANGTAYMVMPFYEGVTLKQTLKEMSEPPDEAWLRTLLEPLTEALGVIHAEQCYHRDIAPDNVILLKGSNRPLLLDFGAARRVIGDMTQALTVILKPGYAPVEQYAEVPGMKQGAWTDVYALAAVVYFAVLGKTPPTSVGRLMNDSYVPMSDAAAGRYSEGFLAAIDRALAVKPEERTQSIAELRADLGFEAFDATKPAAPVTRMRPRSSAAPTVAAASGGRRTGILFGGLAAAALVIGGAVWAWLGSRSTPEDTTVAAASQPTGNAPANPSPATASPSTTPPAIVPTTTATAAPPSTGASSAAESPSPAATSAAPPASAGPLDPVRDFQRIVEGQSPDFRVDAAFAKERFRIDKDAISFTIKTERDGYLYVLQYGSDDNILQVFPNAVARNNKVRAGQSLTMPGSDWSITAGGPPGTDTLIAIVSTNPRDFSALGMKPVDRFLTTTRVAAAKAAERNTSGRPFFLGKPQCKAPCDDVYGARVVTTEEVN